MKVQKLRTSADFRRVLKALSDPTTQPHRWAVVLFGYCTYCKNVTEYYKDQRFSPPSTWSDILCCRGCGCTYVRTRQSGVFGGRDEMAAYYTDSAHPSVPKRMKAKIAKRMSREAQHEYCAEAFANEKARLSHEIRAAEYRLDRLHREERRLEQLVVEEA